MPTTLAIEIRDGIIAGDPKDVLGKKFVFFIRGAEFESLTGAPGPLSFGRLKAESVVFREEDSAAPEPTTPSQNNPAEREDQFQFIINRVACRICDSVMEKVQSKSAEKDAILNTVKDALTINGIVPYNSLVTKIAADFLLGHYKSEPLMVYCTQLAKGIIDDEISNKILEKLKL